MKYALIGCGRIAVNHMKAAINNKLEIVAVCDVLPEKMEALLAKYDLQNDTSIKRYTDYKQMLAENDITLASIATESGIHAEIALYCICLLYTSLSRQRRFPHSPYAGVCPKTTGRV